MNISLEERYRVNVKRLLSKEYCFLAELHSAGNVFKSKTSVRSSIKVFFGLS
jgi:hypothetical protein